MQKFTSQLFPRLLFVFFILLSCSQTMSAQTSPDSLWTIWQDKEKADTIRLEAISNFIVRGYLYTNLDSAYYFAGLMHDFAKERNPFYKGKALELRGIVKSNQANYFEALANFEEALEVYTELKVDERRASAMGNIARVHTALSNIQLSIQYYNDALEIMERKGREDFVSITLNNIGNIYLEKPDYKNAKEYFQKGLKKAKSANLIQGQALCYSNLALVYAYEKNEDSVYWYSDKATALYRTMSDSIGVMRVKARKGILHQEKKEYEKALVCFEQVLVLSEELGHGATKASALDQLGTIYLEMKNYKMAGKYAKEGLQMAEKINSIHQMQRCYDILHKVYLENNDYRNALMAYEQAAILKDSILSIENERELIHQGYRHDYLEKTIADSIRNEEENKVKDALIAKERAEKEQYRSRQVIMFGGIILLLLFLAFIYSRFIVTSRQKKVIEKQKKQVEEQNAIIEKSSKERLEQERLKQERLKADLTNAAQEITRRQEWLEQFKTKLFKVKSSNGNAEELNQVFIDVANQMQMDSRNQEFYKNIDVVNQEFFLRLRKLYPAITPNEQELCGLIRLNLSSKEISGVRNVEPHSIRIARSRLRKKLGLNRGDSLYNFLQNV